MTRMMGWWLVGMLALPSFALGDTIKTIGTKSEGDDIRVKLTFTDDGEKPTIPTLVEYRMITRVIGGTCVGGTKIGQACQVNSDCPASTCTGGTELVPLTTISAGFASSMIVKVMDDSENIVIANEQDKPKPFDQVDLLSVRYTYPVPRLCAGGARNLLSCASNADCTGGTCSPAVEGVKREEWAINIKGLAAQPFP